MSNGHFETELREPLAKTSYFFGDSIQEDDDFMFEGKERWLHTVDDMHIFLPGMPRSYELTYL